MQGRLSNFRISLLNEAGAEVSGQNFHPPGTGSVGVSMTWDLPSLVEARKIRISLNGFNNDGNGVLSLAEVQAFEWYPETARQAIPSSALRSPHAEPLDLDGDSLPDAWEIRYGLSSSDNGSILSANGEYGDPDSDGVPNLLEYKNGTSPVAANGTDGSLTLETWATIPAGTIYHLERSPEFLRAPDRRGLLSAWPVGNPNLK